MKEIIITSNEAGQRFDKLLAKYLNQAPKSFIYKMLRKKNIVLNEKKATGNEILELGDHVKLYLADDTIHKFSKSEVIRTNSTLDVLYEDSNILIINKPVGMLSQKAESKDVSLVEHIISYLIENSQLATEDLRTFRPSICNRLDRNTSGLVVAGKSLYGLQRMGELFKQRSLKKFYRCLVVGEVKDSQFIKGCILAKETNDSQPIETEYKSVWTNGYVTLLEVHLITGRTHQIRAHLASQNHPIIGDYKYGNRQMNEKFKQKYQLTSQLLHAYRLEFPELTEGLSNLSNMEIVAPLPKLFEDILKAEKSKGSSYGNMEFKGTEGFYIRRVSESNK